MCSFTDFVEVPEPKETTGWFVIVLFLMGLIINIVIMIKDSYRKPYLKCQKQHALYKRNNQARNAVTSELSQAAKDEHTKRIQITAKKIKIWNNKRRRELPNSIPSRE